jgi:DNA uptake protein ComE-like DNA-binding protein
MRKLFREFFFLRRGERRALLLVMLLLLLSIGARLYVAYRPLPQHEFDHEFLQRMERLKVELIIAAEQEELKRVREQERFWAERRQKSNTAVAPGEEFAPFPFDPNTVPADSLRMINIPGYVAENILKYRSAGGKFRMPEDIGKIYGMDSSVFRALLPYVRIAKQPPEFTERLAKQRSASEGNDAVVVIELNAADSVELMMIPGIGPSYSKRIIRYRELLGGYAAAGQLMEVYGMDSARYHTMMSYCVLDTGLLRRMDLNTVTFRELIAHPYIDRSETYAILQYRDYRECIEDPSELFVNQIIEKERFVRMAPYLEAKRLND